MPAGQSERHGDTAVAVRTHLAALRALQDSAADAYAAITDADAALRALAERRVAAERDLRHAVARHHAVSRAAAAHARVRPGPLAQLATRFRAGREWRERRAALDAALHEAQRPLAAARRTVSQVKGEFAAQVQERAEAATALRRLTAESETVLEELARARRQQAEGSSSEPPLPGAPAPPAPTRS